MMMMILIMIMMIMTRMMMMLKMIFSQTQCQEVMDQYVPAFLFFCMQ